MGTTASIITIFSVSPESDVEFLQIIFPAQFNVERSDEKTGRGNVLVSQDGKTVFVLVFIENDSDHQPRAPTWPTTWAVDDSQIQAVARHELVRSIEVSGHAMNKIELPGGSTIFMVSFATTVSFDGRKELLRLLSSSLSVDQICHEERDNGSSVPNPDTCESSGDEPCSVVHHQAGSSCSSSADDQNYVLPKFPSLEFKLLDQDGKPSNLPLNAREPVDIETDFFKGKIILLIRPPNPETDDPYWNERLWSQKKRRIVLQIQGKFKREPEGMIYAGAEVSEQMKLGLLTRGLCKVLLGLLQSFTKDIHYSFGEDDELPHIVAPAHVFFDRVVVTPPDQVPPPIDEPLEESAEAIARRKARKVYGKWGTINTYSFSFYSMYIDLPQWQLVGLPASGDLSLKTFWGKSLLRLCMYEKIGETKQHYRNDMRYVFLAEAKHLSVHEMGRQKSDPCNESLSEDDESNNIITWSEKRSSTTAPTIKSVRRSESQVFPETSENDEDAMQFFDAEDGTENGLQHVEPIGTIEELGHETLSSAECIRTELLSEVDFLCPARVDLFSGGKSYTKTFAVNVESTTNFYSAQDCENLVDQSENRQVERIIKANFSPRLSSSERLRRSIGIILSRNSSLTGVSSTHVKSFKNLGSRLSTVFLMRPKPFLTENEIAGCRFSGFVARALSDRHWVEDFAVLDGYTISFFPPSEKKAHYRANLMNVTSVERLAANLCPHFFGYHVLVLNYIGRSVYLMVASTSEADEWIKVIDTARAPIPDESDSVSATADCVGTVIVNAPEFRGLTDEFLHKSSMWQCKNRRILNCARFVFRNDSKVLNPLTLAENALSKTLRSPMADRAEDVAERRAFFESVAELKRADVSNLDEKARLAFFLNVYHIMISHAFLVLGPPDSSLKWPSYFNCQAYQVADDIFSIAELEHCIIRSKMASPTTVLSRFVVPKTRYRMELKTSDFRINFALNCGSLSSPSRVLIFRSEKLDVQLDAATRLYLKTSITYRRTSAGDLEVKLPRVCQWFARDFGPSRQNMLKTIESFLDDDLRRQLENCWRPQEQEYDMNCLEIRYHPFSFECRPLLTLEE